jgi:hypothetical protein
MESGEIGLTDWIEKRVHQKETSFSSGRTECGAN